MIDFFLRIFDPAEPPTSTASGGLSSPSGWFHLASDVSIFFAYAVICALLLLFLARRRDLPNRSAVWMIWLFLLSCGVMRLIAAAMFYYPAFNLLLLVKVLTGLVAVATVFILARVFPTIVGLERSPGDVSAAEAARTRSQLTDEFAQQRDRLEQRATQLTVRDRRVRRAFESSGTAACCWDCETNEIVWEAGLKELLSRSKESAEPVRFWNDLLGDSASKRIHAAARVLGESARDLSLEFHVSLADGREGTFSLRARRDGTSPSGKPLATGLVSFFPLAVGV